MGSKLKKKSKKSYCGFSPKEAQNIFRTSKVDIARDNIVNRSYKDFVILGYDLLHIHFGFGLKRIIRCEKLINTYIENARNDKNMRGRALAYVLKEKYDIDVVKIVNRLPLNPIMHLYYKGNLINRMDTFDIVKASLFNYMAFILTILKTAFRFSVNDINKFVDDYIELFEFLGDEDKYSLTIPIIVENLADEIKYVCDY